MNDEKRQELIRFVRERVRVDGMTLEEAEQEAMRLILKFGTDAAKFVDELKYDLKTAFAKAIRGEVDK